MDARLRRRKGDFTFYRTALCPGARCPSALCPTAHASTQLWKWTPAQRLQRQKTTTDSGSPSPGISAPCTTVYPGVVKGVDEELRWARSRPGHQPRGTRSVCALLSCNLPGCHYVVHDRLATIQFSKNLLRLLEVAGNVSRRMPPSAKMANVGGVEAAEAPRGDGCEAVCAERLCRAEQLSSMSFLCASRSSIFVQVLQTARKRSHTRPQLSPSRARCGPNKLATNVMLDLHTVMHARLRVCKIQTGRQLLNAAGSACFESISCSVGSPRSGLDGPDGGGGGRTEEEGGSGGTEAWKHPDHLRLVRHQPSRGRCRASHALAGQPHSLGLEQLNAHL